MTIPKSIKQIIYYNSGHLQSEIQNSKWCWQVLCSPLLLQPPFLPYALCRYQWINISISGQALKHENLGPYLSSKVPSLIDLSTSKINAQGKTSTLTLLANVMQSLLRYISNMITVILYVFWIFSLMNASTMTRLRSCVFKDGFLILWVLDMG